MQAIADDEGLTRARIQQILAARGEVEAAALEARKTQRSDEQSANAEAFWREHAATVAALADRGNSKQETLDRFALPFPNLGSAIIRTAFDRSGITFSKPVEPIHFSNAVLELGVWYAVGLNLDLEPVAAPRWPRRIWTMLSSCATRSEPEAFRATRSPRPSQSP
jgi:hypothetical protein